MKWISIQLQPDLNLSISKSEVINAITSRGYIAEIQEGEDNGVYININFKTENPSSVWNACKAALFNCTGFKEVSIVTCEGEYGWDDYLLLHHFDPKEKLDVAS